MWARGRRCSGRVDGGCCVAPASSDPQDGHVIRDQVGGESVPLQVWLHRVALGTFEGKLDMQAVLRQTLNEGRRA